MKRTKTSRRLAMMIATGLMLTSGTSILSRYTQMPDFVLGAVSGAGIGIMIVGLVWERRGSRCTTDTASSEGV